MPRPLIIVESATKARTIAGYLGSGYRVESSQGHIRDLPNNAKQIPAKFKDQRWARDWGVDVDHDFEPLYIVPPESRKTVQTLKRLVKEASELFLATDEDREGEAIAWHLKQVLKPRVPMRRMVFHEITPGAIRTALANPRPIDIALVDAQEARRTLDRLVGYGLSPVLWRKVKRGLSAGRVQSVAVRLIVERERRRIAFRSAGFWSIEGLFATERGETFTASLAAIDGTRPAGSRDFNERGELTASKVVRLDEARARDISAGTEGCHLRVRSVVAKPYSRNPYAPFRTSTLQQEASRKLRFGASRTMIAAQRLYERGHITYMRTDSTNLSETALKTARAEILKRYGSRYLAAKPRRYANKVKNAQEAHEAIRPAGDSWRTPQQLAKVVNDRDQQRVYRLIWARTLASQMAPARGESTRVRLGGTIPGGTDVEFAATGRTVTFAGFLRVYVEGQDHPDGEVDDRERHLPALAVDDRILARDVTAKGRKTQPPHRFTEASLIKQLEDMGIGRPSTYASIIATVIGRGYVFKKGNALVPSITGFATTLLLERHFEELVDFGFTARMEDDLDKIARGEAEKVPWLRRFFHGNGAQGLYDLVSGEHVDGIDPRQIFLDLGKDDRGEPVVVRVGRYGPYVARGDDRASVPEDIPPDELSVERAIEMLEAPQGDKILGTDPDSGLTVLARIGRYGPYVQLGEDTKGAGKPKRASLLRNMVIDELALDDALKLLSLPRQVGAHPETGEMIVAASGRYGPYLKMGKTYRNLDNPQSLFDITLEEAVGVMNAPKQTRRRGAAPPLQEFGKDPVSGGKVLLRTGRYGPYVTDGAVNASVREDAIADLNLEHAAVLLARRREKLKEQGKWPPKKRR
ncbi:MAG: type I DNA topoisomerase [bacterium]|nr:type I DNA topoisomerase [bacterium]MDE0290399.1 type I DNA topoisomerase [bacterium]MDE0437837.1 type I DNA topoisomerase [bacterium]